MTEAVVTAVTAPRTYHAMLREDGFCDMNEVLEDDPVGNELDLPGDPPINLPIDPRLLSRRRRLPTVLRPMRLLYQ